MARQGASSNAGFCSGSEKKSTIQLQPLGNPIFHDFLGITTKDHSVISASKTPDISLSEASSPPPPPPPSALASSSGGRGLFSAASDLASVENRGGDYLEGVPFYSPRNEISGPENGNRITGIKRSNPHSAFMGSYRNQIPHVASDSLERSPTMKMLQNGAGGDRRRFNDNEAVHSMQPPRIPSSSSLTWHSLGTRFNPKVSKWERPIPSNMASAQQNSPRGSPFVPRVHQVPSREFNVASFDISRSAADEGSRTGMKSPGLLSSINGGHDGIKHSSQMLLSCEKQKSKTEGLQYKSSNPTSQQALDSNNRQMTIFFNGQAHVFDDVHPNKADIIMALAGSNGGSWSTTLAPKFNVTGIPSDQESAREFHGKLYHSAASGRGVGDNPISTQAGDSNSIAVGDRPRSVPAKETPAPVRAEEPNAERRRWLFLSTPFALAPFSCLSYTVWQWQPPFWLLVIIMQQELSSQPKLKGSPIN